jgi:demethylspheroidene O-methyltransferase
MSAGAPKASLPSVPPAAPSSGALSDVIWKVRDRMVASPVFQRWAVRLPGISWIARKRAGQLFDIGAGFVYSQVLFACVRLKLFDILKEAPLPAQEIARRTGLSPAAAARLAEAAAALQLLQRRGKAGDGAPQFGLGVLGASIIGNPGYVEIVRHHEIFYADLSDPVALLKGEGERTRLSQYWPYAAGDAARAALGAGDVSAYTDLMAASQGFVSGDILDAYDMSRHHVLMDVGGGDGTFLRAAAARAPALRLQLFDLPPVAETARSRFAAAGMAERALCFGGDFQKDPLPQGADAISLVRVAHDHDDDVVEELFRRAHDALPPGGALIVAEPMSGHSGAESMADAYFGFYLLAMGTGRARTPEQLKAMMKRAGFAETLGIPTRRPLMTSMVVGKKHAN